jgi:DNA-binding CsgD family transcriptional regulator
LERGSGTMRCKTVAERPGTAVGDVVLVVFMGHMIRTSSPRFTAEDKVFLVAVRDDLVARPGVYRAGVEYLLRHFSEEALYEAELAVWRRRREIDSFWPKPRRRAKQRKWLCQQLIRAFGTLLEEGIETPDEELVPYDATRAKAVLCLTWLLTDKDADKQPLGAGFKPWGADFAKQMKIKGRAVARMGTLGRRNGDRGRWMELARLAWDVLEGERQQEATEKAGNEGDRPRVQRRRRRKTVTTRPLTDQQQQALELYAKHSGRISIIAQEMGIGHPTVIQHLKAAWQKLPHLAPKKTGPAGKARRLPQDRRGQAIVANRAEDEDDLE